MDTVRKQKWIRNPLLLIPTLHLGAVMHPTATKLQKLLDAEYAEALNSCPPGGRESAPKVVTAPRAVNHRRGTSNRLVWLQVQLFLEDLPKRPGVSS